MESSQGCSPQLQFPFQDTVFKIKGISDAKKNHVSEKSPEPC